MRPCYFDFDQQQQRRALAIAMARPIADHRLPSPRPPHRGLALLLQQGTGMLRLWRRRARERQQLARLDARMLRDIGVSPSEAEGECRKPFWLG